MALDFGETTVGGCTDLRLDQLLGGNTDKEDEFLHLLKLVKQRFASFGERIPAEHMGEFMPIPNYLRGCLVSPWFWTLLDALEALITGKPVLPVDPKERRLWRPQRKQGYDIPDVAQPRRLPPAKFVLSDFLSQIDRFVRQETKAPFSLFVNVRNLSQTDRDAVVAFVNAMDEPLRAMVTIELQ